MGGDYRHLSAAAVALVCFEDLLVSDQAQFGDTREVRRMKWTPWIVGSLCLATIACNGNRRDNDTGAASGTESGTMQGGAAGTATDTAAVRSDTGATSGATGAESPDTARGTGTADQSQPVTAKGDTLQKGGQDQPVTAKGDTLRKPNDSTAVGQQ